MKSYFIKINSVVLFILLNVTIRTDLKKYAVILVFLLFIHLVQSINYASCLFLVSFYLLMSDWKSWKCAVVFSHLDYLEGTAHLPNQFTVNWGHNFPILKNPSQQMDGLFWKRDKWAETDETDCGLSVEKYSEDLWWSLIFIQQQYSLSCCCCIKLLKLVFRENYNEESKECNSSFSFLSQIDICSRLSTFVKSILYSFTRLLVSSHSNKKMINTPSWFYITWRCFEG